MGDQLLTLVPFLPEGAMGVIVAVVVVVGIHIVAAIAALQRPPSSWHTCRERLSTNGGSPLPPKYSTSCACLIFVQYHSNKRHNILTGAQSGDV